MVGDDCPHDVEGAMHVGMRGILVQRTSRTSATCLYACPVIRDLSELHGTHLPAGMTPTVRLKPDTTYRPIRLKPDTTSDLSSIHTSTKHQALRTKRCCINTRR